MTLLFEPRPYQLAGLAKVREALAAQDAGQRSCLAVAATGAGKTAIAAMFLQAAQAKGTKCLFVAHRRVLVDQTLARFRAYGLRDIGVVMAGHPADKTHERSIVLASAQTLKQRPNVLAYLNRTCGVAFHDEAHRGEHDNVADVLTNPARIGLTATPYRIAGRGLGDFYRGIVSVAQAHELVDNGFLVPPHVLSKDVNRNLPTRNGDFTPESVDHAMNTAALHADALDTWRQHANGLKTIGFAASVDHACHLANTYKKAGIASDYISSTTMDSEEAQAKIRAFIEGRILVIWNFGILCEGFDDPLVECVQEFRMTKSRSLWRQMWGRGLRAHPGKTRCIILDHSGNAHEHGDLLTHEHYRLQKTKPKGEKRKAVVQTVYECPACMTMLESWPEECPHCGEELPRDIPPVDITATLVPWSPSIASLTKPIFNAPYFWTLARLAKEKHFSAGWVVDKIMRNAGADTEKLDWRLAFDAAAEKAGLVRNVNGGYEWRHGRNAHVMQGFAEPTKPRG